MEIEDTGFYPNAAQEQKAKLMSKQMVQWHAGHVNASFDDLDQNNYACQNLNQVALQWGLDHADKDAMDNYNKFGKKMVIGTDMGPFNAGPLWIWIYMQYTDNADHTETVVRAPNMRTAVNYWEIQVGGYHYCKLLSPYRALEWIHVDSQYDRGGRMSYEQKYGAKDDLLIQ